MNYFFFFLATFFLVEEFDDEFLEAPLEFFGEDATTFPFLLDFFLALLVPLAGGTVLVLETALGFVLVVLEVLELLETVILKSDK